MMNTFGTILRLTTAGESHGRAIIGILDGMPAGVKIDMKAIEAEMGARRPGSGAPGATARRESDRVELLSGVIDGVTLGTPIAISIANTDTRPVDYDAMRDVYRPSHADYTYYAKYGVRDHRGGGRSSARETAVRVAAGAIAIQALDAMGVSIKAYTYSIGDISTPAGCEAADDIDVIYLRDMRAASDAIDRRMADLVRAVSAEGDSIGGIVACEICGLPAGVGDPVYGKLQACLGAAMLSINAAHGFEYGMGFEASRHLGSEVNDPFTTDNHGRIITSTNHSGGIQGGISNGMPVTFRVAFKPAPTIRKPQQTVDRDGHAVTLEAAGRHDACIVPRAVPVVRAMTALTILDAILLSRTAKI